IDTPTPTIIVTATVPSSCTGPTCQVSVQLQVTPPTGVGIQSASINWGDGATQSLGGVSGTITVSHPYTSHLGPVTITVTVTDTLGRSSQGSTSIVVP